MRNFNGRSGILLLFLFGSAIAAGLARTTAVGDRAFRSEGVRLSGPRWFEAIGPGSGPPLTATLVLKYRLSSAFRSGDSLRLFLGFLDDGTVYFHVGAGNWGAFQINSEDANNYVSVKASRPGTTFSLDQPPSAYPANSLEVLNIQSALPGDYITFTIGDSSLGGGGWDVMRNESSATLVVQERRNGTETWNCAWPEDSFPALIVGGVRADRFVITGPSFAAPGESIEITIKPVQNADSYYQSSPLTLGWAGTLRLRGSDPDLTLPASWSMAHRDYGRGVVKVTLPAHCGVYTISAEDASNPAVRGESNPIAVVTDRLPFRRLYWGSLHNHAVPSGHALEEPSKAYRYARDYADLDFFALTDHCRDSMSFEQFWWPTLRQLGAKYSAPGKFIAFSGYEWTSEFEGHRHVVFEKAEQVDRIACELPSRGNDVATTWNDLAAALAGYSAVAIPHHPAWRNQAPMRWGSDPDDPLRPLAEIYSWHGSSEVYNSRLPMHNDITQQYLPGSGAWIQEALQAGHRLGFTADSDNHRGRPGSNNGASMPDANPALPGLYGRMGITGVYADEFTHAGIFKALRARRTIATTGARIIGLFTIKGHLLGEEFTDDQLPQLHILIHGTDLLEEVTVYKDGTTILSVDSPYSREFVKTISDGAVNPNETHSYYVRAIQADGHHLWMSPIWIRYEP